MRAESAELATPVPARIAAAPARARDFSAPRIPLVRLEPAFTTVPSKAARTCATKTFNPIRTSPTNTPAIRRREPVTAASFAWGRTPASLRPDRPDGIRRAPDCPRVDGLPPDAAAGPHPPRSTRAARPAGRG